MFEYLIDGLATAVSFCSASCPCFWRTGRRYFRRTTRPNGDDGRCDSPAVYLWHGTDVSPRDVNWCIHWWHLRWFNCRNTA